VSQAARKRSAGAAICIALMIAAAMEPAARAYVPDTTVPQGGGCPQPDRFNISPAAPLNRRWSTSLPLAPATLVTAAAPQTAAQITELQNAINDTFTVWGGVVGTVFNAEAHPGLIGPLASTPTQNACSNDAETNVDGLNTICFNQSSTGFTSGVLAFTRVITANAPGVSLGAAGPASFAGQVLDADTLFRNDGQAMFATPAGLMTPQGAGAYDLESLLEHELGHWLGLDHSAVIRAVMFPFAPVPGTFLGNRPTAQAPDGPLADDDRTGARFMYPDPADAVNVGAIRGRVLPANPFALATLGATSQGAFVTGIFGAHVVAVDADSGSVIAGTLAGWSCTAGSAAPQFDGSYDIERLPASHSYTIYAEPLTGIATPDQFGIALSDLCESGAAANCRIPPVNTNFNAQTKTASP
jgi:Matrixin